jgi:SAM-dependent methyltransferase
MSDAVRFWDRIAERYARSPIADEASYESKLERTRAVLAPDAEVLEFGCGTGGTAIAHAPHVGRIRATDAAEGMIAVARRRAAESGVTNVDFEVADFDALEVAPASLDAVLGLNVLHLMPDWRDAVARVHDWLRPGGVFVTSTGCLQDDLSFLRFVLPVMRLVRLAPPDVMFLTRAEVREAHLQAGFTIEDDWQPGPRKAVFMIARRPPDDGQSAR